MEPTPHLLQDLPPSPRTVYAPDYAHIYHGTEEDRYALTTTLSIRNTNPARSITVESVRYFDTQGEFARREPGYRRAASRRTLLLSNRHRRHVLEKGGNR